MSTTRNISLTNLEHKELIRAVTERGKPVRTRVRGFSMSPFIQDGDVLTIAPPGYRTLGIGDVLAFETPDHGRLAVHRIVAEDNGAWLIRGDNSPKADGAVPREKIIGIVIGVERDGRAVRGGIRAERSIIARLNRGESLMRIKAIFFFLHRVAGVVLQRMQRVPAYRACARRLAPPITVAEADNETHWRELMLFGGYSDLGDLHENPNVSNYVALRGKAVAGFVQLGRYPPEHFPYVGHWLWNQITRTRYRGAGIGEELTRRVIAQAAAEGARELLLVVFEDNTPALNLYRKLGFERITTHLLEEQLAEEARQSGRRRIVMQHQLSQSG